MEEAKSFLKKRGKALYPGEDQWAACIRKDGGKDWIQVGDTRHPVRKSHVDEGSGYPPWGDDSSGNPPFSRSVMWFPTTSPKSFAASSRKPQWKHGKSLTWHASKDWGVPRRDRPSCYRKMRDVVATHLYNIHCSVLGMQYFGPGKS